MDVWFKSNTYNKRVKGLMDPNSFQSTFCYFVVLPKSFNSIDRS